MNRRIAEQNELAECLEVERVDRFQELCVAQPRGEHGVASRTAFQYLLDEQLAEDVRVVVPRRWSVRDRRAAKVGERAAAEVRVSDADLTRLPAWIVQLGAVATFGCRDSSGFDATRDEGRVVRDGVIVRFAEELR